ncbi:TPA: hypothetical protein JG871_003929 [Enterobacter hormaechei subsp. xiangfangensis]|nr:hypothetical protein [Enterobacter hormaechei subsp. xiangfangensis]
MNNERILALSVAICHGQPATIPALTPEQLARLLNDIAANREEVHTVPAPEKQ